MIQKLQASRVMNGIPNLMETLNTHIIMTVVVIRVY